MVRLEGYVEEMERGGGGADGGVYRRRVRRERGEDRPAFGWNRNGYVNKRGTMSGGEPVWLRGQELARERREKRNGRRRRKTRVERGRARGIARCFPPPPDSDAEWMRVWVRPRAKQAHTLLGTSPRVRCLLSTHGAYLHTADIHASTGAVDGRGGVVQPGCITSAI